MRRSSRSIVAAVALAAAAAPGCARVVVERVEAQDAVGVRFNRPRPYLLRMLNERGLCQDSVVWLPDESQEYAITVRSGLGTATASATLANGWNLVAFGGASDSRIPETIEALTGALATGAAAAAAPPKGVTGRPETAECAPTLYEFTREGGRVTGLRKLGSAAREP